MQTSLLRSLRERQECQLHWPAMHVCAEPCSGVGSTPPATWISEEDGLTHLFPMTSTQKCED
ncbi:uncharacterized protein EI90DRAFT_3063894 [Cantharellus anzutake]|uniref:uncharacterized protein n=1 Tax=Cantharellus anzutake TaxID=1750568 RepID=UPI001907E6CE|nr:uncharacterized protein EI90DRAFT_3063894 [Cantharellus anzutake]KAF8328879.1 hypothetical protein EI90DRAFT_3063894 [Cantharellus anzutake]